MRYSKAVRCTPLALAVLAALAYLGLSLLNLLYSPPAADANTAPSGTYNLYEIDGDDIWNWDFLSKENASWTTVDWPIRFVFGKNAKIREVKHRIDGQGQDPSISPELNVSGGDMYAWVDDGDEQTGSSWDKDEGKKEGNSCALDNHMRFYAQSGEDRNYNATWEYYIVATLHVDYHKRGLLSPDCDPYFFSWELDEDWWVDRIEDNLTGSPYNWTVDDDDIYWNAGITGVQDIGGGNHSYNSDDYGPYVEVP